MSGFIDRSGRMVVPTTLRTAEPFESGLARVIPYGSWDFGFIDPDGRFVVEPVAKWHGDWHDGVCPYALGGHRDEHDRIVEARWGWVGDGRVLVAPRFERVGAFSHGLMAVQEAGRWGFCDRHGQLRIAAVFDAVVDFSDGLAAAAQGGRWGFVGADGQWRLSPQWEAAGGACGGRVRVRVDGLWHFADLSGRLVSEGFDDCLPYIEGMAHVVRSDEHWLLGPDARPLVPQAFAHVGPYAGGVANVRIGEDQWFLVNAQGGMFGPYVNVLPMTEGRARFDPGDEGDGMGFLDRDGRVAVPPRYQSARGFIDGHAAVKRDDRWTFVDPEGCEIAEPRWEQVGNFGDGVAPVREGGRWGLVDTGGQLVLPPTFDSLASMSHGRAAARLVQWPTAVAAPRGDWHAVPTEGLAHPGFAGAGEADQLRITVCLRQTPDLAGSLAMQQIVRNWLDLLEADAQRGVLVGDLPWIADYAVSLRIHNVEQPVRAADVLVRELAAANLPIQEVDFARFREDPQADFRVVGLWGFVPAVPHPDDPRGSDVFDTFEEYIETAFDPGRTPPASESAQHLLAGRWDGRAECLRFAERTFTLHAPDVRICYGMCQEGFRPPDARTASIRQALVEALAARFDPRTIWIFPGANDVRVPVPLLRDGSPGIERIEAHGRVGYCFGIEACDLLQDIGPDSFRYRENELMEAVCMVVRRVELAPVVTWQRFGDPLPVPSAPGMAHPMHPTMYTLNLWER